MNSSPRIEAWQNPRHFDLQHHTTKYPVVCPDKCGFETTPQGGFMLIPIECWSCGFRFHVDAQYAGKVGNCPHPECGRKYLVPSPKQNSHPLTSSKPKPRTRPPKPPVAKQQVPLPPLPQISVSRKTYARSPVHSRRRSVAWWKKGNTWIASALVVACVLLGVVTYFQHAGHQQTAESQSPALTAENLHLVAHKPHPASADKFAKHVGPFLKKYCFDCHAGGAEEGSLTLDEFAKPEAFAKNRKTAESVFKMLSAGVMPPEEGTQPKMEERQAAVDWIDAKLNYVDCDLPPDPGRVTIRRLNRAEYNNTIRDLVGIDFEPAADFPSDEVGNGFDNIGDVLSLPPLLLEKYLEAAETIAKKSIVSHPDRFGIQRFAGKNLEGTGSAGEPGSDGFITMASSGSVIAKVRIPAKSEYVVRTEAMAEQAGDEPARLELRLDGKKIEVFDIKGRRKADMYEAKLQIDAGEHKLEAAFINDYYNPKAKNPKERDRNLYVRKVEVVPTNVSLDQLPESHRRIVFVTPDKNTSDKTAAEKILKRFITQAFRRPATGEEIEKFTDLALFAISRGETFEQSIQLAVTAVLVSPHFLFRVEDHSPSEKPAVKPIGDYELASRLSYFLWSSMPDDELFQLAAQKKLHEPAVLEKQVRRMLRDPKSQALVDNFASQWLNLRNLEEVSPDPKMFPSFNDELRRDMRQETEKLFAAIMREDRSVMDFLDANFTFVNERLAKHYGISGVKGEEFQKVSLSGMPRAGVLTQASILTLTSNPTRTSPVKRGKWILENLLNEPPPPPPPGVPELEETAKEKPGLSLRKQLELHRQSPSCAACHKTMDPLGLGFENFDAVGKWRDRDGKLPVDASGELPGGKKFQGPIELIKLLKERKTEFRRCLVEKMLTYALGRGLEYYDRCAVDSIAQNMDKDNNRFSRMVLEIVNSKPFLYRRAGVEKKEQ